MNPMTLDELTARLRQALELVDCNGQASARVREVPDQRTIRYYTTLGMIDRPLEMRGRTAYYGRRHLVQLVAIKRLQSQGRSLREIQERLAGATTRQLERWAEIPRQAWLQMEEAAPAAVSRPRERFWEEHPQESAGEGVRFTPAIKVALAEGISLVIEGEAAAGFAKAAPQEVQSELAAITEKLVALCNQPGTCHGRASNGTRS